MYMKLPQLGVQTEPYVLADCHVLVIIEKSPDERRQFSHPGEILYHPTESCAVHPLHFQHKSYETVVQEFVCAFVK